MIRPEDLSSDRRNALAMRALFGYIVFYKSLRGIYIMGGKSLRQLASTEFECACCKTIFVSDMTEDEVSVKFMEENPDCDADEYADFCDECAEAFMQFCKQKVLN